MNRCIFFCMIFCLILIFGIETVGAQSEVTIINSKGFLDNFNHYYLLGEIENVGAQAINNWKIKGDFYDENENLISSKIFDSINYSSQVLSTINPGRKSPFEITLVNETLASQVANYSVSILSFENVPVKPVGLEIMENSSRIDTFGNLILNGTVKNIGSVTTEAVKIIATYYDSDDKVIAVSYASTVPETLEPNMTSSFQTELASIGPYSINTITHYVLDAESLEYTIPEFSSYLEIISIISMIGVIIIIYNQKRNALPN